VLEPEQWGDHGVFLFPHWSAFFLLNLTGTPDRVVTLRRATLVFLYLNYDPYNRHILNYYDSYIMEYMKNEITQKDYYENMYDIESLTDLNKSEKKRSASKKVIRVENLIRKNRCSKAKDEIRNILASQPINKLDNRLILLDGALRVKDRLFSKNISPNYKNLSPKNCALEELSAYLRKPKEVIKKKMLVEKPVDKAWCEIHPDPTSEKEITNFYIQTDAYVYELMAANHIVQTLYSYYVLCDKLKTLNVGSVLDYGAGAGTLSILFENLGYSVTYADLPGKLFDFAKWRFAKRKINIPMINLMKQKIKPEFDCIVSTEVVEHVVDPIGLIKIFQSILKKNGTLVVSESCEYTKDFSSHLENNKKYGGKNFIKLMSSLGFQQILPKPFIPQMILIKK
jgi:hypothetical protein